MSVFITFEGPEGSGKSTVIKAVQKHFEQDTEVMVTREPGGIHVSEKIRDIILDEDSNIDGITEALLFAASRRVHLREKILPALESGQMVLCDRYIDSSLAYQGSARNLGFEIVMEINKIAVENHMPDLTLYLKLEPEIGLSRKKANDVEHNRLDNEELNFHKYVVLGYNKLSELYPERIKTIDASQPLEAVIEDAIEQIRIYINSRGDL
ncbi:dTMP kinase [Phocicoccus pinnipedialis]|uniref:Thymidylate kinase n=1 Tax=Phocicoccus pinnipedialis TaxID=110845 RepID=A0A6V7R3G0_9BACL|nr:dTMP kinase [Jeotgalicoccus pinnipedialis]MBP1940123.1 dTMP kinase [Jeotgalicoccus pinnipedialis]CAD2071929.1 Thymidylate kinase [Jeotgalicoccus pinnipedialis]